VFLSPWLRDQKVSAAIDPKCPLVPWSIGLEYLLVPWSTDRKHPQVLWFTDRNLVNNLTTLEEQPQQPKPPKEKQFSEPRKPENPYSGTALQTSVQIGQNVVVQNIRWSLQPLIENILFPAAIDLKRPLVPAASDPKIPLIPWSTQGKKTLCTSKEARREVTPNAHLEFGVCTWQVVWAISDSRKDTHSFRQSG
jgi:hypothetical protein